MSIAIAAVVLGGCARGDVTPTTVPTAISGTVPAEEPIEVPTVVQPSSSPEALPSISLPAGQVPDIVVGTWSGGEGDQTGETLMIGSDGSYARVDQGGLTYREGVMVSDGTNFVSYDLDGQQESGSWSYTDAAGIEVLGVYFGSDYYSYVRS